MKRLIAFITENNDQNPPEVDSVFFIFKTDDGKLVKVGVTTNETFGVLQFSTLDELVDWVNDQRLKNVQRQIDSGWVPPEDYVEKPRSFVVEVVQPVWESVFG